MLPAQVPSGYPRPGSGAGHRPAANPELAADGDPAEGDPAEGDAVAWLPHPARKLAPSAAAPSQAVTAKKQSAGNSWLLLVPGARPHEPDRA